MNLLKRIAILALTGTFALAHAPIQAADAPAKVSTVRTTASGLKIEDTVVGTGAEAVAGKTVTVHYTGWLYENGVRGKKFDSSVDAKEPFKFKIGVREVIQGWDEGVAGMKVGGKRILTIPPELGYGARGAGGVIPPNATLQFEVELLAV
jgi:peptidylprolyl isomerase